MPVSIPFSKDAPNPNKPYWLILLGALKKPAPLIGLRLFNEEKKAVTFSSVITPVGPADTILLWSGAQSEGNKDVSPHCDLQICPGYQALNFSG